MKLIKTLPLILALGLSTPALAQGSLGGGLFGPTKRIATLSADPATCASGATWVNSTTKIFKVCTDLNVISDFLSSTSTVVGPASSTDLALARWDGVTGLLLQNGVLTSADWNGDLTGPSALDTTTGVGEAFTNQPANDGVEIVSDNAADTTQTWTIIGTTTGTDTVVVETGTLNGTTFVPTVKVDWGLILAVKLSASAAGTVTVREASADATITTLATTVLSKGVETVLAADQSAWNRTVSLVSDGATTKQLGLKGTNSAGATIYDSQALNGTTAVLSNSAFATVTELYTGDLEGTRTATETATSGTKLDSEYIITGGSVRTDPVISIPATLTLKMAGTDKWVFNSSGGFNCSTDGGCDIGNGAADPRDLSLKRNLILRGATSGSVTVKAAAVAGSNTLTLPAGTTDFSATGGADFVLKQESAGAAITVAQLAAADLSNGVSGTGAVPLASLWTWTTPAFDAGNFTGGGTWTVDEADVTTYAYIEIGKTMTVAWQIVNTDVNASSALLLKIPNSRTAAKAMRNAAVVVDNGAAATAGIALVAAAGTNIELYRIPVAAFTNTTADNTSVYGQITFEIQ